jgi:rod shape determining protein RodA
MEVGYDEDRQLRMARERVQSRWMSAYDPVKHLDPVLVLTALALTGIGLVAIYSAKLQALTQQGLPTTLYITRQLLALIIGIGGMVVISLLDYRRLRSYAPLLYAAAIVLLVLVITSLGTAAGGAQRWIIIGGFQLQPSELAKIAVLLLVASILHESGGRPAFGPVALSLVVAAVPAGLVFLQPDLGTSLTLIWLVAVLLLIGGTPVPYLAGLTVGSVGLVVVAIARGAIQPYQLERLTAFLAAGNPSSASAAAQGALYQTQQSMVAIGSGQFAGRGLFEGTQTSLGYVPENHTDFIFTVIGEQLGFLGASLVLGLFTVLVWRGLRIAILAKDRYGTLLATGVVAILAMQVFVNVGMTIGIMPVTGLPLPFVSYGGTSLIVWFAMIGLLLNVHMRRF